MSRSSPPRAFLPPTDHVARELLKRGARDPAILLLRAATRRDPGERACAALLKALEARPDAAVSGPEVELDLSLAEDYVARGMFLEARAVLSGAGLDRVPPGADHARVLDELLAPLPADAEPELLQAFRHLMTGGASLSLSLVEEHMQRGLALPPWAARRRTLLRALLLDHALESAASVAQAATAPGSQAAPVPQAPGGEPSELARELARLIAERDLRGAAARLWAHCASAPDDVSAAIGAEALERILHVLDRRDGIPEVVDTRTMPMGPQKVAELHLRMGNFAEAERLYRRVVVNQPENLELRAMLDDVQVVTHFLVSPSAPVAPRAPNRATVSAAAEIGIRPTVPLTIADYDAGESTEEDGPEELARLYTDVAGARAADPSFVPSDERVTSPAAVTRRASSSDISRGATASRVELPPGAPSTAPVLSKKGAGPSSGFAATTGYSSAKDASSEIPSWDDDETNTVTPAVEAELLLKQGFAIRALELYRMLAEGNPADDTFRRRIGEIEALIMAERLPMPDEVTVQRDVSDLRRLARPTALRLSVPENVRAAAAAVSAGALPGTLDASDLPRGEFDDDVQTSIAVGSRRGVAPVLGGAEPLEDTPTGVMASVSVTRIVVLR